MSLFKQVNEFGFTEYICYLCGHRDYDPHGTDLPDIIKCAYCGKETKCNNERGRPKIYCEKHTDNRTRRKRMKRGSTIYKNRLKGGTHGKRNDIR
jgi:hypothetical protein